MAETVRPRIYGVSELNYYLKEYLAEDEFLCDLAIRGEVSGCKYHSSGHIYFTLKEQESAIKCVMFRSYAHELATHIHDGDRVVVIGSVALYQRDACCQLYAKQIFPDGQGKQAAELEKLRRQLEAEGLFAPENKKPLPRYIFDLGVITSSQGAAWADIRRIAYSRNPSVKLTLYPAAVQGVNAAQRLSAALAKADKAGHDALLIGRGGGAEEDLAAFDTEQVTRAVAACQTPVISAVGHESDFSLCDLAADIRAATPTHGVALAVTDRDEVLEYIEELQQAAHFALLTCVQQALRRWESADIDEAMAAYLYRLHQSMQQLTGKLSALDPLAVLMRGYGVITNENKETLRDASQIKAGDRLDIRLASGSLTAIAEQIKEVKR